MDSRTTISRARLFLGRRTGRRRDMVAPIAVGTAIAAPSIRSALWRTLRPCGSDLAPAIGGRKLNTADTDTLPKQSRNRGAVELLSPDLPQHCNNDRNEPLRSWACGFVAHTDENTARNMHRAGRTLLATSQRAA